ncbi:hypothetical protein [Actinoplanes sp. NPDC020271]|uniref:hypothetical protein n=1 Tax=Actinoplanes sp. NPDC020271 TaxID=3363896 RepID=UPI0037B16F3A
MGSPDGGNAAPYSAEARWLRAALTGDHRERRRIAREQLAGGPPFQVTPLACGVAARRLFDDRWDRRVITTFARRLVERTPAGRSLHPRHVEAILRGMTGETELFTAVPDEAVAEIVLASLLGLADELALDDRAVDALLVEAVRETAAVAAVSEPPDPDDAPVLDGDRWRRTFERLLAVEDFVPRARPVARPPRPFPEQERRYTEPASLAGRYLRHLLRGNRLSGPPVDEIPQVDLLRVARLAFTVAVRTYLHRIPTSPRRWLWPASPRPSTGGTST